MSNKIEAIEVFVFCRYSNKRISIVTVVMAILLVFQQNYYMIKYNPGYLLQMM